jgi:hypothetical protein
MFLLRFQAVFGRSLRQVHVQTARWFRNPAGPVLESVLGRYDRHDGVGRSGNGTVIIWCRKLVYTSVYEGGE